MNQSKKRVMAVIGTALMVLVFFSCDLLMDAEKKDEKKNEPWGSSESKTVTMTVEAGETIYLVKYNPSPNVVPKEYAGNVRSASSMMQIPSVSGNRLQRGGGQTIAPGFGALPTHHKAAMEFNALPPLERTESPTRRMARAVSSPPAVGDTKPFWVQNRSGTWIQITATLKKNGTYCRIWVDNARFGDGENKIGQSDADALAANFDIIYPKETAFFGYELGGGSAGNGGIDGDPLIQILVYDIDDDGTPSGGTLGFFYGVDEYLQADLTQAGYSVKSNQAEIFYVDAHFTKTTPALMYSTLAHEFQHMIQYNTKTLRLDTEVAAWYNEMLSMLAEDMLAPYVGVTATNVGHPINSRIPWFNTFYWVSGVTDWFDGDEVILSYANAYAFGAYLARNYGGAKLVKAMATNNAVDIASVNAALASVTSNAVGFEKALEKFPETLLHTSSATYTSGILAANGLATYNHTATGSTWNLAGYDFAAFNITNIEHVDPSWLDSSLPQNAPATGPVIWGVQQSAMRPYGIDIQGYGRNSGSETRTISVTVTSHTNSPVKMYFLGKKSNGTVVKKDVIYQ